MGHYWVGVPKTSPCRTLYEGHYDINSLLHSSLDQHNFPYYTNDVGIVRYGNFAESDCCLHDNFPHHTATLSHNKKS